MRRRDRLGCIKKLVIFGSGVLDPDIFFDSFNHYGEFIDSLAKDDSFVKFLS